MKPYKLYRLIALCYLAFQANLQGQGNLNYDRLLTDSNSKESLLLSYNLS